MFLWTFHILCLFVLPVPVSTSSIFSSHICYFLHTHWIPTFPLHHSKSQICYEDISVLVDCAVIIGQGRNSAVVRRQRVLWACHTCAGGVIVKRLVWGAWGPAVAFTPLCSQTEIMSSGRHAGNEHPPDRMTLQGLFLWIPQDRQADLSISALIHAFLKMQFTHKNNEAFTPAFRASQRLFLPQSTTKSIWETDKRHSRNLTNRKIYTTSHRSISQPPQQLQR